MFWSLFSPRNLYKVYERPNINSQAVEYSDNYLPGRHSLNWTFTKRNYSCKRYIDFSIIKSGISDKWQKISPSTLSEDRVSGSYCGFKRNDSIHSTRNDFGNNRTVPPISYKRPSFSESDLSTNWETVLFNNCSLFSSSSQQTTDHWILNTQKLRKENPFVKGSEGRTAMVDSQCQTKQRKSLLTLEPQILITSDASVKSWGPF